MSTLWAVRRKRDCKLLGVTVNGTGSADFCGSYEARFCDHADVVPHFFASEQAAKRAIAVDTPWYNSGLDAPQWNECFTSPDAVDVVGCSIVITVTRL